MKNHGTVVVDRNLAQTAKITEMLSINPRRRFFTAPLEKRLVKLHVTRARLKAGVLSGYEDFSGELER